MNRILITAFLLTGYFLTTAQDCAQSLRLASSSYDQGRLHEIPELLKKCLNDGFTTVEKVNAYKLLALSYLYLEEPEKADVAMLSLLATDHFFEPNQAVDPAEFIGLYNTFRTKPLFSIGGKFSAGVTLPTVTSNHYVANGAKGAGEYSTSFGIGYGLSVEKALFQNKKNAILKRLILAPEIILNSRKFGYTSPQFYSDKDNLVVSTLNFVETQSWGDLNILIQYKLKKGKSTWDPFVVLGPGINYLISASREQTQKRGETGNGVSGKAVDVTASNNKLAYSVIAGAGVKLKLGSIIVMGEARYQYGLSNIPNTSSRFNAENVMDYGASINDFKLNNLSILVGLSYPVFKPRKLVKK
jgi:hypothetical protein